MTKGSDLLVAALENEGVTQIFGVPGEENLDVVESLRNSTIELIVTRHEQSAAFLAATYGRLTGRPGVCISTLGPGALNLVTGAAYAHLGAMPMVMITGQKGIMTSRQARFQMVDMIATMRPLTKSTRQIVSTATIPTLVRDAFRLPWRSALDRYISNCPRTSRARRQGVSPCCRPTPLTYLSRRRQHWTEPRRCCAQPSDRSSCLAPAPAGRASPLV